MAFVHGHTEAAYAKTIIMELTLIRHGQTQWNIERKMQGRMDSPLTAEGIKQLKALKDRLTDYCPDKIYCSPLGRAKKSAEILFPDFPMEYQNSFAEISLGDWEGKTYDSVQKNHNDSGQYFWSNPKRFIARPGGESFQQVQERAIEGLKEIFSSGLKVVILSHSVVIKSILHFFEGREISRFWDPPGIFPASLSIIELQDWNLGKIISFGDHSHCSAPIGEKL